MISNYHKVEDIKFDVVKLREALIVVLSRKSYDDATPKIVFKCISNCPAEKVAKIIYNATPLIIKNAFLDDLLSDDYKNDQEQNYDSYDSDG